MQPVSQSVCEYELSSVIANWATKVAAAAAAAALQNSSTNELDYCTNDGWMKGWIHWWIQ